MRQAELNSRSKAGSPLALAARLGRDRCAALEADHRSGMGQFLTPPSVAALRAGMFEPAEGDVRLLDPGAGVGVLSAAFVEDMLGRRQ